MHAIFITHFSFDFFHSFVHSLLRAVVYPEHDGEGIPHGQRVRIRHLAQLRDDTWIFEAAHMEVLFFSDIPLDAALLIVRIGDDRRSGHRHAVHVPV